MRQFKNFYPGRRPPTTKKVSNQPGIEPGLVKEKIYFVGKQIVFPLCYSRITENKLGRFDGFRRISGQA